MFTFRQDGGNPNHGADRLLIPNRLGFFYHYMPTIWRIEGLRVVTYPNGHRPEHVHLIGAGAEAVFELAALSDGPAGLPWVHGAPTETPDRLADRSAGNSLQEPGKTFLTLSDADVGRAEKRMQARLQAQPHAIAARYDRRDAKVIVSLSHGLELGVPVRLAPGLSGASTSELADIDISPTGLGLHLPRLDTDLYLPALIEGIFGTHRWKARMLGKGGGKATSAASKAAAHANSRRGGRPRKEAPA